MFNYIIGVVTGVGTLGFVAGVAYTWHVNRALASVEARLRRTHGFACAARHKFIVARSETLVRLDETDAGPVYFLYRKYDTTPFAAGLARDDDATVAAINTAITMDADALVRELQYYD